MILSKKHSLAQLEVEIDLVGAKSITATKHNGRWTVRIVLANDTEDVATSEDFVLALSRALRALSKDA